MQSQSLVTDVRPTADGTRWLATCADCQEYAVTRTVETGWEWVVIHECDLSTR